MASILVVEEEELIAILLRLTLEQDGHTVLVAHSGQDAMRLARDRRPDLAFVDVMLPFIDGTQLALAFRSEEGTAAMPVILMSAGRATDGATGAVDFLTKPFDIAAVSPLMRRHLRHR